MKKLIIAILILMNLSVANAVTETLSPYPGVKDGINIWPMAKINPADNKILLADKPYIDTSETDSSVNFLLDIKKSAKQELRQYNNVTDDADTHLKSSIGKLHLDFKFNGMPGINSTDVIGYAVAGGYTKKGWNGAVEFADIKDIGICSFTIFKISKVVLPKEKVSYAINGKASETMIAGNHSTGFLYDVNWYTNTRRYALECANLKFDPEIIDRMVAISKRADEINKA